MLFSVLSRSVLPAMGPHLPQGWSFLYFCQFLPILFSSLAPEFRPHPQFSFLFSSSSLLIFSGFVSFLFFSFSSNFHLFIFPSSSLDSFSSSCLSIHLVQFSSSSLEHSLYRAQDLVSSQLQI